MRWDNVTEAVVSGIATAVTWAILLFIGNLLRNLLLERRLRRSFRRVGHSFGIDAFGLVFANHTKTSVKVWEVGMYLEKDGVIVMNYSGVKAAQRRVKLLFPGDKKQTTITLDCPSFRCEPSEGAVVLDFDMTATWQISNSTVVNLKDAPKSAFCILEYSTLIGGKKRITVEIERPKDLRTSFLKHRQDCIERPEVMNVKVNKLSPIVVGVPKQ